MKLIVTLHNWAGELDNIECEDTVTAAAEAAINLIRSTGMMLHEGDTITVTASEA